MGNKTIENILSLLKGKTVQESIEILYKTVSKIKENSIVGCSR